MNEVDNNESLRTLFGTLEHEALILETGFRKPLNIVELRDRPTIEMALRNLVLLRVKPELDQFITGLMTCGVYRKVQQFPDLMAPLLTSTVKEKPLTKGISSHSDGLSLPALFPQYNIIPV